MYVRLGVVVSISSYYIYIVLKKMQIVCCCCLFVGGVTKYSKSREAVGGSRAHLQNNNTPSVYSPQLRTYCGLHFHTEECCF